MKILRRGSISLFIVLSLGLAILAWFLFAWFGKHDTYRVITYATMVVDGSNTSMIDLKRYYHDEYIIKANDEDKVYLKYYTYYSNKGYSESRIELSQEQFSRIENGRMYWFELLMKRTGQTRESKLLKIFENDPIRE